MAGNRELRVFKIDMQGVFEVMVFFYGAAQFPEGV